MLSGKKILITGVRDKRSIAYGVARSIVEQGGRVGFWSSARSLVKMRDALEAFSPWCIEEVDLTKKESIKKILMASEGYEIDGLLHSVAKAPMALMEGGILDHMEQTDFLEAINHSVFSLASLVKEMKPYFNQGASVVTMSFIGAQRPVEHYNTMGVAKAALESLVRYLAVDHALGDLRVNAVSAGPIITVSSRVIRGIQQKIKNGQEQLAGRKLTLDQIADVVSFLLSSRSSSINGQTIYADHGLHLK